MIRRSKYSVPPEQWRDRVRSLFEESRSTREWVLEGFYARWPELNGHEWQSLDQYRWPKSIREALRAWARSVAFDRAVVRRDGGHRTKIRYRLRNIKDSRLIALPSAAMLDDRQRPVPRHLARVTDLPPEAS